jgi:hypothetical protein
MAALGVLTLILGLLLDLYRVWANLLVISFIAIGLGLAGILLSALFRVTGATWAGPVKGPLNAMASLLPLGAAGLLIVLVLCPGLYPWTDTAHEGSHHPSAWQQVWLQRPFFLGRALSYLACWLVFGGLLRRAPRSQALAGLFLVVFALTWWLASCDWIMSLEPAWSSTMFGVYSFAGLLLSGLAAVTLLFILGRASTCPAGRDFENRLHDLGKLLFAFSTFWMYIWFCQYMLIWFVNIPEETSYYVRRLAGIWQPLVFVNVLLNWVAPFFLLLPRKNKRDSGLVKKVCILLLVGRCLDVYLMVLPAIQGLDTKAGLIDLGLLAGGMSMYGLTLMSALVKRAPVELHTDDHRRVVLVR